VIDAETIDGLTANLSPACAVILDPPRGGTGPGVVERIALRRPGAVLHIFCNADIIGEELSRWTSNGYDVCRATPIDMFPGTSDIETMVLLRPNPAL
jgi:tRNA/tmRNA/rRNA uracil-C5-methylase (TrmA/RlmC/RlmD family)